MGRFEEIEFPSAEEKDRSIAWIVSNGVAPPKRLCPALARLFRWAGAGGICYGVWDCMLLALLLDGLLWAAVCAAARQNPQLLYLLVFLASPALYAMLHLLTVWKEVMAGMYQVLMVCRLSLRQMTALRLLLFGGVSAVLSSVVNLGFWMHFGEMLSMLRLLSLSMSALFFYAWVQLLVEWRWKNWKGFAAAPVLWSGFGFVLLLLGERGHLLLEEIPSAALLACAGVCAGLYMGTLKKYYFEPDGCAAVF